jgi:hypothetical protein
MRLVHAPVDQEVRRALGDRRSDAQTGAESFGIVDQRAAWPLRYLSIACNARDATPFAPWLCSPF